MSYALLMQLIQLDNPTDNEISLQVHNMHLYYDHILNSFPLYIF